MPRMTQAQIAVISTWAARYKIAIDEVRISRYRKGIVRALIVLPSRVPGLSCMFTHEVRVTKTGASEVLCRIGR